MARSGMLTTRRVDELVRAKVPGHWGDGGGLTLQISRWGTASWTFRYRANGKLREAGIGSLDTLSLEQARRRARQMREQRLDDIDPIEAKRAKRRAARLATAKAMTFEKCAEAYIKAHEATWRNGKHAAQWGSTLGSYAYPVFGDIDVRDIDTALVTKAIEPIWTAKPETANRVRGRIEAILDWATVREFRRGDNPARWRGHLDHVLPAPSKAKAAARRTSGRQEHHAALPYPEIAPFIAELRQQEGIAARALEFAILTAARTGDVIGATWAEFNLTERLWTVPGSRMKAGKEHRVPLSGLAIDIVAQIAAVVGGNPAPDQPVFPGARPGRSLSNMAMLQTLRRMGRGDLTAHGFRSTFRDWAAERTNFPAEVAEMALAHAVGDKVEAAYRRGDLFQKRRQIMDAWAKFCGAQPATGERVVPLRRGQGA